METLGETVFDSVRDSIPEACGTVTTALGAVIDCVCPSIETSREATEYGERQNPACTIRVKISDVAAGSLEPGETITLTNYLGTETRLRVIGRVVISGLLDVLTEAVYG